MAYIFWVECTVPLYTVRFVKASWLQYILLDDDNDDNVMMMMMVVEKLIGYGAIFLSFILDSSSCTVSHRQTVSFREWYFRLLWDLQCWQVQTSCSLIL